MDVEGCPVYLAEDTRPLCIVDTANRLLTSAARIRWERLFCRWLHQDQRGFLPGRSMLANVVDLEHYSMMCSLLHKRPAAFLFDFAAAFPSLSQDFLLDMLKLLPIPRHVARLARSFYVGHRGCPTLEGQHGDMFELSAGIRQGCPLSPLLFVVVVDGLLRCMQRESPDTYARMYADDTAIVVQNVQVQVPQIQKIFKLIGEAAHLRLNIQKCVHIPLFLPSEEDPVLLLTQTAPEYANMKCDTKGTYLGFVAGLGKGHLAWDKALAKAEERVRLWQWCELGLFFASQTWNTFITSIVGFVAQLESPPPHLAPTVAKLLRKAAHGCGNWCRAADIHNLRRAFQFPGEFRHIGWMAKAAMFRTSTYENVKQGGLQITARDQELREAYRHTVFSSAAGSGTLGMSAQRWCRCRPGVGTSGSLA